MRTDRLTASRLLSSALGHTARKVLATLEAGQVPDPVELAREAGLVVVGEVIAAQAKPEPEEAAPDTERQPWIDAEGAEA